MPFRRTLLIAAGGLAAMTSRSRAAATAAVGGIAVRPAGTPAAASPEHFSGTAQVSSAFVAEPPARTSGGTVSFAPRARTDWHSHPLGQTLIVLSGTGLVQRWGDPPRRLSPGDVAWIPPGEKHWHGAGDAGPMVHVAVSELQDGRTVDWFERVSDAQYAEALRS